MSSSLIITILLFLLGLVLIIRAAAVSDRRDRRIDGNDAAGNHRFDHGGSSGQHRSGNRQRHRLGHCKYRTHHGNFTHLHARCHPHEPVQRQRRSDGSQHAHSLAFVPGRRSEPAGEPDCAGTVHRLSH